MNAGPSPRISVSGCVSVPQDADHTDVTYHRLPSGTRTSTRLFILPPLRSCTLEQPGKPY